MSQNKNTLLKRALRLLFPEAFFDEMLRRTITRKDCTRLFLGNFIFFSLLTLLYILYELFLAHDFLPVRIPLYLGCDILLSFLFAFLSYCWIRFRQRDREHFSKYNNHDSSIAQ